MTGMDLISMFSFYTDTDTNFHIALRCKLKTFTFLEKKRSFTIVFHLMILI